MAIADLINGFGFELIGGLLIWLNVRSLYRDKEIKGISWPVTAFFAAWGLWNLFYYPHLHQWLSFAGGLVIVSANLVWVALAVYYEWFNPLARFNLETGGAEGSWENNRHIIAIIGGGPND